MGNRGNIVFKYENGNKIYFYSHWEGDQKRLKEIIKLALIRGKDRWDDEQYLARIVFCEMIQAHILETDGYGISSEIGDGEDSIVEIDIKEQTVDNVKFEDFIK